MNTTKTKKPRMKFTAFLRKYGRILIGGLIIAMYLPIFQLGAVV